MTNKAEAVTQTKSLPQAKSPILGPVFKLRTIRFPNQVQVSGEALAKSGFAVGGQGVTEIRLVSGVAVVQRVNRPTLVFNGPCYGELLDEV
jgi:threonine/homoserine efflux transporter RhtA